MVLRLYWDRRTFTRITSRITLHWSKRFTWHSRLQSTDSGFPNSSSQQAHLSVPLDPAICNGDGADNQYTGGHETSLRPVQDEGIHIPRPGEHVSASRH